MTWMQNVLERTPFLTFNRFLLLTFTLAISSLPRLGSASVPPPSVGQSQHSNALLALGTLEGEWIGTITVSHNQNGSRTHPIRRVVALENGSQFLRADTDYDVRSSAPSGPLRSRQASETVIFTFDSDENSYKLLPLGYFNPLGPKEGRAELLEIDAKALTSFAADGPHVPLADITAPSSIREMTLA